MSVFEELIAKLLPATQQVDRSMSQLKKLADTIHKKYDSRLEFDRWKQTVGGRKWKRRQHQLQAGRCRICQGKIEINGSHIDHIKPLKHYPHLAVDLNNLQILCADCNLKKGQKEITSA